MDVFLICGILHLLIQESIAINCHDCTSWSPYCRESVDRPFPAAVATSECKKTDTCYLKKEENGVITRGCADWWMSSQVDIHYVGCQTQEVPWMGKQTWCFCQQDYCNGGSIQDIENGIGLRAPELRDEMAVQAAKASTEPPASTANPWDQDWESIDWNQWTWNDKAGAWESSELNELSKVNDAIATTTKKNGEFNDFDKDYEVEVKAQSQDPAWNHWYWHADSDRPQWPTHQFREHTTEAAIAVNEAADSTTQSVQKSAGSESGSTESWDWGNGWEQLLPWWEGNFHQSTTMPQVGGGMKDVNSVQQQHDQDGDDQSNVIVDNFPAENWEQENRIIDNNEVEISASEFFCWDCYSDSPLCGETVDNTKAHYLGKTACPATNKCFVRHDGDVTYRGCADGWIGSVVNHDYVGCEVQKLWGKEVEWCFCTASLCNGDSMMDIQEKYLHIEPEVFKGEVYNSSSTPLVYDNTAAQSTNVLRTTRSIRNNTTNTTSSTDQTTEAVTAGKTSSSTVDKTTLVATDKTSQGTSAKTTSGSIFKSFTTNSVTSNNVATDKSTSGTDQTTFVAGKTSGSEKTTSGVDKTTTVKDGSYTTTGLNVKGAQANASTAQTVVNTETSTGAQSTVTVKIDVYMNQINTTTQPNNTDTTLAVTSTQGTQPLNEQTTYNSTTMVPTNQTAVTQKLNTDDSTTHHHHHTNTTVETTVKSSQTDSTKANQDTTSMANEKTTSAKTDAKTTTGGETTTAAKSSETTTAKVAIRKRESGLKYMLKAENKKASRLFEALVGK